MRDSGSRSSGHTSSKPPFRLPRHGAIVIHPAERPPLACPAGTIARGRACGQPAAERVAFRDVLELAQAERAGRAA